MSNESNEKIWIAIITTVGAVLIALINHDKGESSK